MEYLDDAPSAENYGRCTKSMAYTMLAKLYLNAKVFKGASSYDKGDMNKVIEYCDKVINSGYYEVVSVSPLHLKWRMSLAKKIFSWYRCKMVSIQMETTSFISINSPDIPSLARCGV